MGRIPNAFDFAELPLLAYETETEGTILGIMRYLSGLRAFVFKVLSLA